MLKSQDCIILLKLLANPGIEWSQRQLAETLCISLSEINGGIKRLMSSGLLRKLNTKSSQVIPIIGASEEFLIHAIKYIFPGKLGEYTRGMPTAIAASVFKNKIALGNDPIPVWPDAQGKERGVALTPLHSSAPKALHAHPDQKFYDLLAVVDVIRQGGARERNIAIQILKDRLKHEK